MIELRELCVSAGEFRLEGLSLVVPQGQHVVLMGKSGQGKTTLLEAICGLRPVVSGAILLAGVDVTRHDPADRGLGYVPQDLALFPTMTVGEHLAFALRLRRWPRTEIARRVGELAGLLRIEALLDRRPQGLSGGERQRVALGRALSFGPRVLLLDEPLSSLDPQLRGDVHDLLRTVKQSLHVTTLHVTHNPGDAAALADAVFVLQEGRIAPANAGEGEGSIAEGRPDPAGRRNGGRG